MNLIIAGIDLNIIVARDSFENKWKSVERNLKLLENILRKPHDSIYVLVTVDPIENIVKRSGSHSVGDSIEIATAGVGVTKAISPVPLFSQFFSIVRTHVRYWILRLYLTGIAAAQLRWYLSNMNVIQRI